MCFETVQFLQLNVKKYSIVLAQLIYGSQAKWLAQKRYFSFTVFTYIRIPLVLVRGALVIYMRVDDLAAMFEIIAHLDSTEKFSNNLTRIL
jgi:hypothetical protein